MRRYLIIEYDDAHTSGEELLRELRSARQMTGEEAGYLWQSPVRRRTPQWTTSVDGSKRTYHEDATYAKLLIVDGWRPLPRTGVRP